jgi:23S rRNA (guanosine2251-2'-O)-methyltransferase
MSEKLTLNPWSNHMETICGFHAIESLLDHAPHRIHHIFIYENRDDKRLNTLIAQAQTKKIAIRTLSATEMEKQFGAFRHQGVAASITPCEPYTERDLSRLLEQSPSAPLILILDSITDPHNLGACIRTANAAGVSFIVIPKDKSAPLTPVVSKVASGAMELTPIVRVTNLARAIEILKDLGVWVYGAAGEVSTSLYQLDTHRAIAIVMGAEGEGLRQLTRARCDDLFSIPMQGTVASLNVSVATGICLYEVVRQRMKPMR